ncbi:hypothetical protein BE04_11685 [Sorangium cellulosum]|uniref:Uncharacterized protein n=2 Tax=Sorangium cellulosum TaxID=56 RepID=A0A150PBG3_SORCE|nr:hypothetical protein SCE1572_03515 [Sorangium cellulosum So0157-2]KYF53022.1 hypothetical protein BE04_11685 [Sorangium cellulosum]
MDVNGEVGYELARAPPSSWVEDRLDRMLSGLHPPARDGRHGLAAEPDTVLLGPLLLRRTRGAPCGDALWPAGGL